MSTTIESLELEIVSSSGDAVKGIDALTLSLGKLKSATVGKLGLSAVIKEVDAFNKVDANGAKSKMVTLSAAISTLTNLPKANLSGYITPLKSLPKALEGLSSVNMSSFNGRLQELVTSLAPLSNLGKSNISSYITSLKKLPTVLEELNKLDMGAFTAKMQEVATAMKPLGDEMQKISNGFSAMPTKIQKLLKETNKIPSTNKKAGVSFTDFYHKIKVGWQTLKKTADIIADFIKKSMDYTENLNLFTVSLGGYATTAKEYAESLEKKLGIDSSEWMRAQGVFMTLATGFGVASDKSYLMSKNLTQLGHDLSSFYNISTEEAMQKLQSGLAGELEPLRRLGYDLSQAKLEAIALEKGITKSVSNMTQAEKAQLRYYAIMTQVTQTHGDLARTLDAPANQFRVLKAQINVTAREIGNIFIPVLSEVLPYLIAITKAVGSLAKVLADWAGYEEFEVKLPEIEPMQEVSEGTEEALSDAVDSAKKLKNYMMGFDELNVINPNSGTLDGLGTFDIPLPEYNFLEGFEESKSEKILNHMREGLRIAKEWIGLSDDLKWDYLVTNISENIDKIDGLIAGASLALGAILAFTGANIPLGIALMAGGALKFATEAALNSDKIPDDIANTLAVITTAVSSAALAVGTILAFTGANIPLGIGLMAMGALNLATAIAPNWEKLPDEIKQVASVIMGVAGVALVLGSILAFSGGNIPLGIAMLATGAALMVAPIALNWNKLAETMKGEVGLITGIVSTALLAMGAILAFSGVNIPLGIGLMAVGAVGLAAAIGFNWDAVVGFVKTAISSILAVVSGASLALGVLLLLSGAGVGLGLALIFAGLAGSFVAWKLDDNPITKFVKKMANGIIGIINMVIDSVNEMFHIKFDGLTINGVELISSFDVKMLNIPKIPLFAEGGFPEQGQLFIAREAGAEMVGSIGRRTAVANNDQIVGGIASGVASANEEQNELLREQNTLLRAILEKEFSVDIDGKRIMDSVEKHQRERGRNLVVGGVL